MNLKVRLALLYSFSVFVILVISALLIYALNENFRKEEFFKRLVLKASEVHSLFYTNPANSGLTEELNNGFSYSLPEESIHLFDSGYHLMYSSPDGSIPNLSKQLFTRAKSKGEHTFTTGNREAVILFKKQKNKESYALASANDIFGRRKIDNLKLVLTFSVIGGILLSGLLAFFYVKQAMKPLEELKHQIEKINEENLKQRIFVRRDNNEVQQIAKKFNAMLDRLEQAFEQRKNFVQHASHELRTPLANMLSQTEAALSKDLPAEGFKKILFSLKEEQQYLINLTNSLLTLSRYEKMSRPADWTSIRIDEVLYDTIDVVKQLWPEAEVSIGFEEMPQKEEDLVFEGNESLMKSAVLNLIKNALQYSDNFQAKVTIDTSDAGISIQFQNTGKHLSAEERSRLFIPFFRGENSKHKKGYGLGLSIVKRIMAVHKATITYEPVGNDINRFTIFLPH